MLKSEFGALKNDTTVKEFKEEEAPKEEIKIDWNPTTGETKEEEAEKESPKKKESKLKKAIQRLKEQQKKEEEEEEEIIGIKGGGK